MKETFNHIILKFGWQDFLVPKEAALKIFELLTGKNIFEYRTQWEEQKNIPYIKPLDNEQMPKLTILDPCTFHAGILNQEEKDKKEAAERKAKESA
jgi:CRISPR/Cas system-associated protein Cas10 (large subunit of type III CRISPR-Cas system)